ncbi:MAG: hypothetical protein ACRDJB_11045 [Actinomycetota bacterium]
MAYCPPELLDDLAGLLAEVHTWAWVIEKKPNVFFVRRQVEALARGPGLPIPVVSVRGYDGILLMRGPSVTSVPYIVHRFAGPHSIKWLLSGGRHNRTSGGVLPMRAVAGVDGPMSRPP